LIVPLPAWAEADVDAEAEVDVEVAPLDDAELLHAAAVTLTAAMARAEAALVRNLRVFIIFSPLLSGWNPMR
jgi:hypothetical protein